MQKLLEVLSNSSIRRFIVFLLTFATVALNKRIGLDLDPNAMFDVILVALGYIGQSAAKEVGVALADAKVASVEAAVKSAAPAAPSPS